MVCAMVTERQTAILRWRAHRPVATWRFRHPLPPHRPAISPSVPLSKTYEAARVFFSAASAWCVIVSILSAARRRSCSCRATVAAAVFMVAGKVWWQSVLVDETWLWVAFVLVVSCSGSRLVKRRREKGSSKSIQRFGLRVSDESHWPSHACKQPVGRRCGLCAVEESCIAY